MIKNNLHVSTRYNAATGMTLADLKYFQPWICLFVKSGSKTDLTYLKYFPNSIGILRETTEEKNYADFSLFENRDNWYSTFNFHYRNEQFNRLADLNEFNTLLSEQTIKDVIAGCIQRRRQRRAHLYDRLIDL